MIAILFWLVIVTATAVVSSKSRCRHVDAMKLTKTKLNRFRQHWRRERLYEQLRMHHTRQEQETKELCKQQGSRVTFSRPNLELVSKWLWSDDSCGSTSANFNHDSVGMTNPWIQVATKIYYKSHEANSVSLPTVKPELSHKEEQCWWPETTVYGFGLASWRIIRLRRRVGRGAECYRRVRDAALNWEFQTPNGNKGILPVLSPFTHSKIMTSVSSSLALSSPKREKNVVRSSRVDRRRDLFENSPAASIHTLPPSSNHLTFSHLPWFQIWSGPGKRFVTYTKAISSPISWLVRHFDVLWLPSSVYVMNAVAVVYDYVDQRGPGTTYSSTAYATTGGHWLCGEERVTVAWRDKSPVQKRTIAAILDGNADDEGDDDFVDVEILSVSKPAPHLWSKFIWPIMTVTGMQTAFFNDQLAYLQRVAVDGASTSAFEKKTNPFLKIKNTLNKNSCTDGNKR